MEKTKLSDRIEKLGAAQQKFDKYQLTRNPFPAVPISPSYSRSQIHQAYNVFCEEARSEEINRIWDNFIEPAYRDQISLNHWIESDIGAGKSGIMIYLAIQLAERMMIKNDVVSLYAPIGDGFGSVYDAIIEQLGLSFFEELIYKILSKLFVDNIDDILEGETNKFKKEVQLKIETNYLIIKELFHTPDEPEFPVDAVDSEEIKGRFLSLMIGNVKTSSFVKASRGQAPILIQLIEEPDIAYNRLILLYRNYKFQAIIDLFYLFSEAGYNTTYLFLDQLDHQIVYANWSRAKRDRIFMRIRRLIVESLGRLAILVTSYPHLSALMRSERELEAALPWTPERVTTLHPLTEDEVRAIFATYLKSERLEDEVPELAPFTMDSITAITQKCGGLIRAILTDARSILEAAANNDVNVIDNDFVINYYENIPT